MKYSSESDGKARILLDALFEEAIDASADEIREDIAASGGDPVKIAAEMRETAFRLLLNSRKSRLVRARDQIRHPDNQKGSPISRSAGQIRRKLRELVAGDQSFANGRVALAFRNGVAQSDNDVLSLWQDLIDLGAVTDNDLQD